MAPAVAVEERVAELDEVFLVLSLLPGFVAIIEVVVWCFGSGISASFCVGHKCCSLHIGLHSHVLQRVLIVFLASFQSFPPLLDSALILGLSEKTKSQTHLFQCTVCLTSLNYQK